MPPRQPLDPGTLRGTSEDELLRSFVAAVRQWRDCDTQPVFRRDDLIVLTEIIGTDPEGIERRLIAFTGCDRPTAKRLRRLLLAGFALPVAFTVLTVAPPGVLDASGSSIGGTRATPAAVVIDRPAPSSPPTETVVTAAAAAAAAAPLPSPGPAPTPIPGPVTVPIAAEAPPPAPVRASVPVGAEATVSIERVGLDLPVFGGGQDVIDQGVVTHYWAPGWREPVAAGAVGTYWLAAHHETHGSPFGPVPSVLVGDEIDITTAHQTFTYTVTSLEVVEDDAGFGPVYGTDPGASLILLQTCLDHVRRLLVHGVLTAVA